MKRRSSPKSKKGQQPNAGAGASPRVGSQARPRAGAGASPRVRSQARPRAGAGQRKLPTYLLGYIATYMNDIDTLKALRGSTSKYIKKGAERSLLNLMSVEAICDEVNKVVLGEISVDDFHYDLVGELERRLILEMGTASSVEELLAGEGIYSEPESLVSNYYNIILAMSVEADGKLKDVLEQLVELLKGYLGDPDQYDQYDQDYWDEDEDDYYDRLDYYLDTGRYPPAQ